MPKTRQKPRILHGVTSHSITTGRDIPRSLVVTHLEGGDVQLGVAQPGGAAEMSVRCSRGVLLASIQAGRRQPITGFSIEGHDRIVLLFGTTYADERVHVWLQEHPLRDHAGWDIVVDRNELIVACD